MSNSNKSDNPANQAQPGNKWQKLAEEAEKQAEQPMEEGEQLEFPPRQKLEDQLTAMERQVDEYKQQALRAQAELENVRRRAERDISNAHKYGVEQLINSLLPVLDGLVNGLESGDAADAKIKPLHEGMKLTLDLLQKALVKFGVEIIEPAVGDPFDPRLHQAMGMQPQPGAKANTVLNLLQKGYQLHGRVLRPAMVMVAG